MTDWAAEPLGDGVTRLYPHQRDGARWLLEGRWRLLTSKPRMGKTLMCLAAANATLGDYGGNVIVACPANLREQWRRDIDRWRIGDWRSWVVSYNDLAAGKVEHLPGAADVLIVDEAHYAKDPKSQRTKALYGEFCRGEGLADRARFCWLLTGTPMPNGPQEMWTHLRRFAPTEIAGPSGRPRSYGDFQDHYCATLQTTFGRKIVGGRRLPQLRKVLEPHMLIQDYNLLPDVPNPPEPLLVHVEVDKAALSRITEFSFSPEGREVRNALTNGGIRALAKLGTNGATLRRLIGLAKIPPVVEMVEAELEADTELKIVVFAVHVDVVTAITKRLSRFGACAFSGGMTAAAQATVKRKLNTDPKCRVVVASLLAASEGHDFSAADMVIRAESSWVPTQNEQADRRIYNLAKRRPICVRALVIRHSVDEDIMHATESKTRIAVKVFG